MKQHYYDAIIVGAGVGGLVCGCYLVKNGLKVLIVERNSRVGGYCDSFSAKGFKFDAFVHSLGNLSEDGELFKLFSYLRINNKLSIIRHNPSDTIITPDCKVSYWNNVDQTVQEFSEKFSSEAKNISIFFKEIIKETNIDSVVRFRNKTFRNILDKLFTDEKLKKILSLVILGNLGVPVEYINAFTAIKHYKQFMVDGGYYLGGGVQVLPAVLADQLETGGGKVILSQQVVKIGIENGSAKSVTLRNGQTFYANFIVSGCDARQTFFQLIGERFLKKEVINLLNSLSPSLSLLVLYVGLSPHYKFNLSDGTNAWFMLDYNYSEMHKVLINYTDNNIKWLMIRPNHKNRTLAIYVNAPFIGEGYWDQNKKVYMDQILKFVEQFIPDIANNVTLKVAASPSALNKWTENYHGAGYGWASIASQFMIPDFLRDSIIKNLFLCGHWSTLAQGVPGVAIVGERVAKIILAKINRPSIIVNLK